MKQNGNKNSQYTQAELAKQEKEIEKRKLVVMKDLEYAEPAVLEAQRGVQNIKSSIYQKYVVWLIHLQLSK